MDSQVPNQPAYALAPAAAAIVNAFFARHLPAGDVDSRLNAPVPETAAVIAMVDAAFWASLRREEGRSTRIASLAFVSQDRAGQALMFEQPLPLAPDSLTRLAPAVERPGIHLAVWPFEDELRVWGAARTLPDMCLVLEAVEPGLLVLKFRRGAEFGKFGNIAVLRGDRIRVVDEGGSRPDGPALLAPLIGLDTAASWADAANGFVQLAVSMRGHARGGSLLVVPSGTKAWRESIVYPVSYSVAPPFARLAQLMSLPPQDRGRAGGPDGVRRLVNAIAGLTAVDGAAIVTDRYEVLAFGAKIGRREGHGPVERVVVTEPVVDDVPALVAPTQLGGTRHLSAAQFVHDQRDALALVASQDGRFTVFAWSPSESMVHAHRIEALLF